MKRWLINGVSTAQIDVNDRGFAYGDGLFETIAVRNGMLRFFGAHYARLVVSCRRLGLAVPEQNALAESAQQLCGGDREGTLKIIVSRGAGERGYRPPDGVTPTCAIGFTPEPAPQIPHNGIRARVCETRISSNPATAGMKTLNRLEQVLARAEWDDPAISEGIMRDSDGYLICGTQSNLFVVSGGRLWTPVLDQAGVHGIMRAQVLNLAEEQGIDCREQRFTLGALDEADDVFFTNARVGIWPVAGIDEHVYARHVLTQQLMLGLAARGVSECVA